MAKTCGLGVSQFVHHVRQLTNLPPMHYLNDCRLKLSAMLLHENPSETVLDIALTCDSPRAHILRHCSAKTLGLSPREFRRNGGKDVVASVA